MLPKSVPPRSQMKNPLLLIGRINFYPFSIELLAPQKRKLSEHAKCCRSHPNLKKLPSGWEKLSYQSACYPMTKKQFNPSMLEEQRAGKSFSKKVSFSNLQLILVGCMGETNAL